MKYDLTDKNVSLNRVLWYLAWPAIVEQLLVTLVQYVDTAMVGSMGGSATASIAVSASLFWFTNGMFTACAIGFAVLVGKNLGARNEAYVKRVIRQSMLGTLILAIFLLIIIQVISPYYPIWMGADKEIQADASAYMSIVGSAFLFTGAVYTCSNILRCAGNTRTPLVFNTLTNLLNIIGNFFLIFPSREVVIFGNSLYVWGAGLGVTGAAIATAISTAISGCLFLLVIFLKPGPWQIHVRDGFKPDLAVLKEAVHLATPAALERATNSAGQLVMTALVTGLGTTALAANHLAVTAESLSYLPAFGFGAAATTLVSQSLGAKMKDRAWLSGRQCTIIGTIFMTCTGVLLFFFARPLISIFTPDEDVILLGAKVLQLEAFAQPFYAMNIVISGVLRGAGDTKWPFYINTIGMWVVRMSVGYVLAYPLGFGLTGAWIGMVADLTVRGLLSLYRLRKKQWLTIWE